MWILAYSLSHYLRMNKTVPPPQAMYLLALTAVVRRLLEEGADVPTWVQTLDEFWARRGPYRLKPQIPPGHPRSIEVLIGADWHEAQLKAGQEVTYHQAGLHALQYTAGVKAAKLLCQTTEFMNLASADEQKAALRSARDAASVPNPERAATLGQQIGREVRRRRSERAIDESK